MREIKFEDGVINFNEWEASGKDWRENLEKERRRLRAHFDTTQYERSDLTWYRTAFLQYCINPWDTSFYDRENRRYRIEELLDEGRKNFGGYDSIRLWNSYPRLGVDERNQFDFFRDMPGGLKALRDVVDHAHARGVRVFIPYIPWDRGTHREDKSTVETFVEIVRKLDVDGIFLDTIEAPPQGLREALNKVKPGIALRPELMPHSMRTAEVCAGSLLHVRFEKLNLVPGLTTGGLLALKGIERHKLPKKVFIVKWIEPRFALQGGQGYDVIHRSPQIANDFFHGVGERMTENIGGWWVPFSAQDKRMLRRCIHLLRAYKDAFFDPNWQAYVDTLVEGVFAHQWHDGERTVYTLFNNTEVSTSGPVIGVPYRDGMKVYDVWEGTGARTEKGENGTVNVYLRINPLTCSCIVVQPKDWPEPAFANFPPFEDEPFYHKVQTGTHLPLPTAPSEPASTNDCPEGMILVEGESFLMRVHMELTAPIGGCYSYPTRQVHPDRLVNIKSFFMDKTEVTNLEYKEFLDDTRYRPSVIKNFLKYWTKPEGKDSEPWLWQIPKGKENHPVVYVDLNDARCYARWARKRLPTEEEWQYAAQGRDERNWPWGNEYDPNRCNGIDGTQRGETKNDIKGSFGETTPVDAYPAGASPSGCLDMCGNVWEWTESERDDGHTRYAILRGGCYFRAGGSLWYVCGGAQPCDRHAKMLLLHPGLDRCSTIGFRCVKDIEERTDKIKIVKLDLSLDEKRKDGNKGLKRR